MSKGPEIVRSYEGNVVKPPGEVIREIYSDEEIGFAEAEAKDAILHYHDETKEYYFVLEGEGKVEIEGEILSLEERDFVCIPPGTPHRAYTENETFESLVISSPPWKREDHHTLEE